MKRKYVLVILSAFLLSGCGLVPGNDDELHNVVVKSEDKVEYELAKVTMGDIESSQKLIFKYSQTDESALAFGIDNMKVTYVYVKKGDRVNAGDILASTDSEALLSELSDYEYSLKRNELLLKQVLENKQYDIDHNFSGLSRKEIDSNYEETISSYNDEIYFLNKKIEKLKDKIAKCSIVAPISGVVTNVHSNLLGSLTKDGEVVIRLIDDSSCAFILNNTEYKDYFKPGQEIELTTKSKDYLTIVDNGHDDGIYLKLKETDPDITVGLNASIIVDTGSKKDVLLLNSAALHKQGDKYFVYKYEDSGLRSASYVEIGMRGDGVTEILSGLNEGDLVIIK